MQSFADYVDRATEDRASQRNVITKENYTSLAVLAEELGCEQLKLDLSSFRSRRRKDVVEKMTELRSCSEDDRVWALEDELSEDVDVLLAQIQDPRFRDWPVDSLWKILAKSQAKGSHINSTNWCQHILSNPSHAPLVRFVSLGEVPAEMALTLLNCPDTQDWVSPKTFCQFVTDSITRLDVTERELETSKGEVRAIKEKLTALEGVIGNLKQKSEFLERKNEELVRSLKEETATANSIRHLLYCISKKESILTMLRQLELNEKRKHIVVRKASCDLYNWLDPDDDDELCCSGSGESNARVEIEFPTPIRINGFKVISNSSRYGDYPKTFDVTFSDGEQANGTRKVSFVDEKRLNGGGLSVEKSLDVFSAKIIRIESQGPNWGNSRLLRLGGFELFSPDEQYRDGVFRSIFAKNRGNVSDIFDVRASNVSGSEFHKRDNESSVYTWGLRRNEWFEVGLVHGKVIVTGYRIRKYKACLRSWSLRGSNNRNTPLEAWTVIHRYCETEPTDKELQFECSSETPFKFFRIVHEGQGLKCGDRLSFNHFDLDGVFIPN